jgi:hypothetical protein
MKLKECTMGQLVINYQGDVGHIVGLQYSGNYHESVTSVDKKLYVIPVIRFAGAISDRGVHPGKLSKFDD